MEAVAKNTAARTPTAGSTGRTRAYYGYSRNGCARCKQQRVRCDEQHPECDRCVRVGAQCPGYEQKLRWSAKHEVFQPGQTGQKKQQARRKQVQKTPAPAPAGLPLAKEAAFSQATEPLAFQRPRPHQQQPQQQQQQQQQTAIPRSHPSPSSPDAVQQQTLPLPLTTATTTAASTTTATTPTTQFTPNSGSPEPDIALPHTAAIGDEQMNHPRNPSWLNLLDQLAPPVSEFPDFYTALSNPYMAAQKALDGGAIFHGNIMASAGLDGGWAGGLSSPADVPMPTSLQPTEQDDDVEYISRADPFPRLTSASSPSSDFASSQSDGFDGFLRGRWSPKPQNQANSPFGSFLRPSYGASRAGRERDGDASEAVFGNDTFQSLDVIVSPASKALQPVSVPVPARQATPSLSTISVNDFSTVLVEFYFKVTAQLYSCYDSRMNPFRSAVVRSWSSSRVLYCTLQSMAAASLIRDFPEIAPIGRQLRQEAAGLLSKAPNWDINSMLAILMLGGTASWHESKDLGLPFFNQIAACLASAPASAFEEDSSHRSYRFFRESMLYWEMLLAFVADNDTISTVPDERPDDLDIPLGPDALPKPRVPHPWTGFCAETQLAVLKVGRLIRRQRKFDYAHRFASMAHINQLKKDMTTARELEARLVSIAHPTEQSVRDTEDRNTPVWHLLTLAEIIRDTGLVQLYHVFPDLLTARLRRERRGAHGEYSHLGATFGDDGSSSAAADEQADITQQERSKWLTAYTLRSLERMKTLPIESGTRDFQPFLLVALSSELRISKQRRAGGDGQDRGYVGAGMGMGGNLPLHALLNLDMETVEVTRARGFIHSRLTAFLHALPPKPILACLDIVTETWRQMDRQAEARAKRGAGGGWRDGDGGEADVYWMDVMIQNGWETIMA